MEFEKVKKFKAGTLYNGRRYLNVPFDDVGIAKAWGCMYDPARKQWWALPDGKVKTEWLGVRLSNKIKQELGLKKKKGSYKKRREARDRAVLNHNRKANNS